MVEETSQCGSFRGRSTGVGQDHLLGIHMTWAAGKSLKFCDQSSGSIASAFPLCNRVQAERKSQAPDGDMRPTLLDKSLIVCYTTLKPILLCGIRIPRYFNG